ncbi:hypothetical protein FRC10_002502 [Ceratobasidium sp. 414]|nr:hypothetical protein FRC10_002502 [Ceratobasidium sp. 414]
MPPSTLWYKQRHANAAAYRPHRPESSFRGTVTCTLIEYFKPKDHWMIIPEILLRDVIDTKHLSPVADVPYGSLDDDAIPPDIMFGSDPGQELLDPADVSMESQGGIVLNNRTDALRPDFGVAKAQSKLFSDRNHLYVEVKNGEVSAVNHGPQIVDYANGIASAIPPDFGDQDVILMLVHAATTYFWRIRSTSFFDLGNIWEEAEVGKTHGYKMNRILKEVSTRCTRINWRHAKAAIVCRERQEAEQNVVVMLRRDTRRLSKAEAATRRALFLPSAALRQFGTTSVRLAYPSRTTGAKTATTGTKTVARAATSQATGQETPEATVEPPTTADEIDIDALLAGVRTQVPATQVPARAVESGGGLSLGQYDDEPSALSSDPNTTDWYTSFHGLSAQPFPKEAAEILMAPLEPMDVEIKPDGLLYLPEIKYRRILNRAFGPGGWGLAPRSGINVSTRMVSREYALVCLGRLVGVARGEQEYFDKEGIPTAAEGAKSNALMRCCKDLGVASELWDPRFIREFKAKNCVEAFVEHAKTKKMIKAWRRKDAKFEYPYMEKGR